MNDVQASIRFDGPTYEPSEDRERLKIQLEKVKALMLDGRARTLDEIREATGIKSDASVSARLRDLRKPRFGALTVISKRIAGGLYSYRVVPDGFGDVSVTDR